MTIKIKSLDAHADGTLVVPNKLGIGTSSPGATLNVVAAVGSAATIGLNANGQSSNTVAIGQGWGNATDNIAWIYNRANADLVIATNNLERMRITSSGSVGIGTSSPLGKFEVDGNIILKGAAGGNSWTNQRLLFGGDGTGYTCSIGSINNLGTINTPVMTLQDNGKVGIGTSSPSSTLHVIAPTTYDIEAKFTGGNTQGLAIQNATLWEYRVASDTGAIGFNYTGYNNGTSYYRDTTIYNGKYGVITHFQGSTGRVGIGTSSPLRALHVVGKIAFGESGTNGASLYSGANDSFAIFPYSNTPNPNWALYVAGNGAGAYDTTYESLALYGNHLQFRSRQNANIYYTIYGYSTSYSQTLRFFRDANVQNWDITCADSGSAYRMYIRDSDVNDGVYMAQNSTSWTANSDSRLKDVQGTITDALAKVGQLTGVKFTWKRDADNPDAKVRVGLIAQDVQAVLPEAVDDESPDLITDEETGKVSGGLGVRYTEVVPLLVNAIKELTARVVTLEQAAA